MECSSHLERSPRRHFSMILFSHTVVGILFPHIHFTRINLRIARVARCQGKCNTMLFFSFRTQNSYNSSRSSTNQLPLARLAPSPRPRPRPNTDLLPRARSRHNQLNVPSMDLARCPADHGRNGASNLFNGCLPLLRDPVICTHRSPRNR